MMSRQCNVSVKPFSEKCSGNWNIPFKGWICSFIMTYSAICAKMVESTLDWGYGTMSVHDKVLYSASQCVDKNKYYFKPSNDSQCQIKWPVTCVKSLQEKCPWYIKTMLTWQRCGPIWSKALWSRTAYRGHDYGPVSSRLRTRSPSSLQSGPGPASIRVLKIGPQGGGDECWVTTTTTTSVFV